MDDQMDFGSSFDPYDIDEKLFELRRKQREWGARLEELEKLLKQIRHSADAFLFLIQHSSTAHQPSRTAAQSERDEAKRAMEVYQREKEDWQTAIERLEARLGHEIGRYEQLCDDYDMLVMTLKGKVGEVWRTLREHEEEA
ncbi:hypothetical protein BU26DRAFT_508204 [Trematosphaeria pertusa]|uniref:Uncharacterized protein n=1 Tax=Trematosphaeria pertusa TaxID=390896 RepID=A0A6A6I4Z0_9PLEO|nr:uncharacterized protein BU26DRAFT_508204 [Trematosphaeria pertusa]KAF2245575.1 hypothetical protein BU26DRAFT_508204 [Trematosphaeria pertusa]